MRLHIIFDKTARYSIDLSRFIVSYPKPQVLVFKRIHQRGSFERSYEYVVIMFDDYHIYHANIYTDELNLDDLPYEEIEAVIFKAGY